MDRKFKQWEEAAKPFRVAAALSGLRRKDAEKLLEEVRNQKQKHKKFKQNSRKEK